MKTATIELDCVYGENENDDFNLRSFLKANSIAHTILEAAGPAGGCPFIRFVGPPESIVKMLKEFFANDEEELEELKEEMKICC